MRHALVNIAAVKEAIETQVSPHQPWILDALGPTYVISLLQRNSELLCTYVIGTVWCAGGFPICHD